MLPSCVTCALFTEIAWNFSRFARNIVLMQPMRHLWSTVLSLVVLASPTTALQVGDAKVGSARPAPTKPALNSRAPFFIAPTKPALTSRAPFLAACSALVTALPAVADEGDLDVLNGVLSVAVGGLFLFVAKFAVEALGEVASQTPERLDRLGITGNKGAGRPRSVGTVYDDTDFTYKDNQRAVENSRTRVKKSKQFKADGTRLAPWMVIDEDKVAATKAKRAAAEKQSSKTAAASGGFKNPFA